MRPGWTQDTVGWLRADGWRVSASKTAPACALSPDGATAIWGQPQRTTGEHDGVKRLIDEIDCDHPQPMPEAMGGQVWRGMDGTQGIVVGVGRFGIRVTIAWHGSSQFADVAYPIVNAELLWSPDGQRWAPPPARPAPLAADAVHFRVELVEVPRRRPMPPLLNDPQPPAVALLVAVVGEEVVSRTPMWLEMRAELVASGRLPELDE